MYDIFSLPNLKFPEGFVWGSATAGHQIEGDNVNSQFWAWEQAGGMEAPSGKACNHYQLYKQDINLFQQLDHRAFRISVEWCRIEPREGQWDTNAIEHYVDELRIIKETGTVTFVTLMHGTHPQWFEEKGAFQKIDNIKYFERFIECIVPNITPFVDFWMVINEFNLNEDPQGGLRKLNMLRAHGKGYHIIKQFSKAPVSSAHALQHWFPARVYDPMDNAAARYADWCTNEFFFHAIRTGEMVYPFCDAAFDSDVKGSADYWAINYYTRTIADSRKKSLIGKRFMHKYLPMIKKEFYLDEMFPEGLTTELGRISDRPIYITENGVCCDDDRFRIVYIALHLCALKEAMARGADVRGYLYWSFMDNWEWGSFIPRFGMVHVDFDTFVRTPKPSAYFFKDIIQENGLTKEIIKRYLKELPTLGKVI